MVFEFLYEMNESSLVQHIGYATADKTYDFTLVFSKLFFGKTLVTCLQSGRAALLDYEDVSNVSIIQDAFKLPDIASAQDVSTVLLSSIPIPSWQEEY